MLDALIPGIHDHTLSPQDRFNIQTDVYALARASHIGYVDYLKLLRYAYKHEDNLTVWKSILRQLTELSSIFDHAHLNNTKHLYQSYVLDLLSNIFNTLEWDPLPDESSQTTMLRSLILTHMGINGHKKIIDEAHRRFNESFIGHNQKYLIDPNIRAAIYLSIAKTGNEETFEQLKSVNEYLDDY
jgi:adenosine deaminase